MANPDVSAISSAFVKMGPTILQKKVNEWDLSAKAFKLMKRVSKPTVLPKISGDGTLRPYRSNDDSSGNDTAFTDRTLTVYPGKVDLLIDPEQLRNTYLDDMRQDGSFAKWILETEMQNILKQINDSVMGRGVRNAGGSTAVDLADGFLTKIDALITATTISPVATGAITSANAVAKAELMVSSAPAWLRKLGGEMLCSYQTLDDYKTNYRASFGYNFSPDADGNFRLDGTNFILKPQSWMGTEDTLILAAPGSLVVGTDLDAIQVHTSPRFNLIETRLIMPVGFEIADLDAILVNDQF